MDLLWHPLKGKAEVGKKTLNILIMLLCIILINSDVIHFYAVSFLLSVRKDLPTPKQKGFKAPAGYLSL